MTSHLVKKAISPAPLVDPLDHTPIHQEDTLCSSVYTPIKDEDPPHSSAVK